MGTVYKRENYWWLAFKVPGGKRVWRSSGIASSRPEREAQQVLAAIEKELAGETRRELHSKMVVAEWAKEWTAARKAARQTNAAKDQARLELHVLPTLGAKRVGAVGAADVRRLVAELRAKGLAPRTVINTYGLVRRLFADAVAEELILSSPCVLKRRDLPKKTDKDPAWRARAVFTRDEAEQLLSSLAIPLDRRVTYGLGLCAGMREGEIAALRWESFDEDTTPLARLLVSESFTRGNGYVKATKTGNPREVPVHPTLARLMGEWRASGFAAVFGREPRPTDLLVPNREGGHRTDNTFLKSLARDLEKLGLRSRRMHDTRRTFISLGRSDGANSAVLKTITHDQVGDQFDQYTSFTWAVKCEAVSALNLRGRVIQAASKQATGTAVTRSVTLEEKTMATAQKDRSKTAWAGGDSKPPLSSRTGASGVNSRGSASSGGPHASLKAVHRHNVTSLAIAADLDDARRAFEENGDRERLAARLRVLLAAVRR